MGIQQIHLESDIPPAYRDVEGRELNKFQNIKGLKKERLDCPEPVEDHEYTKEFPLFGHEPIVFMLPDPTSILCRCGTHLDTTTGSDDLPEGVVRCRCGYIVSSAGWSRWEPRTIACPTPSCFTFISWPRKQAYVCSCGIGLDTDGTVCIPLEGWKHDLTKVRCRCGQYVDTTKPFTIVHNDQNKYEYRLPKGSARCACGRTVRSDGTSIQEHTNHCCTMR